MQYWMRGYRRAVTYVAQNVVMTSDEHREQLLDEALEATFPASDPLAITLPSSSDDEEGDD
ncbi:MAG TPA: hypothetical protein VGP97_25830 [Burkholderiales bacterium]|jgi:hypothetical protein|nr:hypothetical protein [Burkholderiales bacterium]